MTNKEIALILRALAALLRWCWPSDALAVELEAAADARQRAQS